MLFFGVYLFGSPVVRILFLYFPWVLSPVFRSMFLCIFCCCGLFLFLSISLLGHGFLCFLLLLFCCLFPLWWLLLHRRPLFPVFVCVSSWHIPGSWGALFLFHLCRLCQLHILRPLIVGWHPFLLFHLHLHILFFFIFPIAFFGLFFPWALFLSFCLFSIMRAVTVSLILTLFFCFGILWLGSGSVVIGWLVVFLGVRLLSPLLSVGPVVW